MLTIGLGVVANVLRSRRFHELVMVFVIGLAAVAGLSRENQARALARVVAWDEKRNLRDQRTPKARSARARSSASQQPEPTSDSAAAAA